MSIIGYIKDTLKSRQKMALIRLVALLIAIVMLLLVAVWAWFANNTEADASGLNISVNAGKNMYISLDGGLTYHPGIDLLDENSQIYISESNKIKDNLMMLDITSDGKTFLRPVFSQTDGANRTPDTSKNWSDATPNQAYISLNINFRTTFPGKIYLGSGTDIVTFCESNNLPLTGTSSGNPSTKGDFSKDCIVGALRLSAVDGDNLRFVMIPRSDIELITTTTTVDNITSYSYEVKTGNAVSNRAKIHEYYNSTKEFTTNNSPLLSSSATQSAADENAYLTTTVLDEESGQYIGNATINIWLEGCDDEVKRALSGGKYNIALDFVAHEVTENE